MKTRFLTSICIIALLLAGCAPAATPPPTAAPTRTPTATAIPTSTATPPPPTATPTATPNATATAAAAATARAETQAEEVKAALTELGIPVETGRLAYFQTDPEAIELTEHQQWIYSPFAEGLNAADFAIVTDVTWDTDAITTCGFFFRSEGNFEQADEYIFEFLRLSGLPAWGISYMEDGRYKNYPVDNKTSGALDLSNGATNNVVLVAEGEKFTIYFNGERQGSYYDYSKQRLDGKFAFSAWQDSGTTTCTFDNTAVWVYE